MQNVAVQNKKRKKLSDYVSVTSIPIYMFVGTILVGTFFLMLPLSQAKPVSLLDALFTATSATCITGLLTINVAEYFTPFGQVIIMVLIELGAIGIITVSSFFLLVAGKSISFKESSAVHDTFTASNRVDIRKLVKVIVSFFILFELSGTLAFWLLWRHTLEWKDALFQSLFHSVSAFCNAGISTFPNAVENFKESPATLIVFTILLLMGGIGFLTISEAFDCIACYKSGNKYRWTLQSKLILYFTFYSIAISALIVFILEYNNGQSGMGIWEQIVSSIFHVSSARTAGFATINLQTFTDGSIFVLILLMYVGGAPISTGGGIKVTTLAILIGWLISRYSGEERITLMNRTMPKDAITKSISIVFVSIIVLAIAIFVLLIFGVNPHAVSAHRDQFLPIVFEAFSAFGTVGLSLGITPHLTVMGKIIIALLMLMGRLGPLTIAMLLAGRKSTRPYEMAEENLMVG